MFLCAHHLLLAAPIAWASVGSNVDGPHRDRDINGDGGGGAPAQLHTAARRRHRRWLIVVGWQGLPATSVLGNRRRVSQSTGERRQSKNYEI